MQEVERASRQLISISYIQSDHGHIDVNIVCTCCFIDLFKRYIQAKGGNGGKFDIYLRKANLGTDVS